MLDLTRRHHDLTHILGHLICEALGVDPMRFDEIFDKTDPDLAASLSHNFAMDRISPELRPTIEAEYAKPMSKITGAHIDGPPLIALLVNDRPGLQVIGAEGRWISAPVTCRTAPGDYQATAAVDVIPGSVIVNSGGTLMHLSRGRFAATLHRVNTCLIPMGESRISLPFFLLPKMEGPLVPWIDADVDDRADGQGVEENTGINEGRDRGVNASVNRMDTFPQVTKRWWAEEFDALAKKHAAEVQAETQSAYRIAQERAARNRKDGDDRNDTTAFGGRGSKL